MIETGSSKPEYTCRMKCAAAVISSASVRKVRLSIDTVYQAGTLGSTNEMRQTGRTLFPYTTLFRSRKSVV